MPKKQNTKVTLISAEKLLENIPKSGNVTSEAENKLIPIHVGQKMHIFLNEQEFIIRVIVGNKESLKCPGYCCKSGEFSSNVETSATEAISSLYMQIFHNKTRKSDAIAISYNDKNIIEELQEDVTFFLSLFV
ncbi:1667_t:CDS:2 [Funneliformis geosporum]|uniref:1667_t:CDS:1 n=1 Tax=Funneliformis geosporum TaxID=1117311 RepID=A0A9W4WLN8_9GLOM|nr:1667_t:CDS:2 [Funneliformis geosporum]